MEINGYDNQVLIFSHFEYSATNIYKALKEMGLNVKLITGQTTEKENTLQEFKDNKFKILIATDCLSYGVNLPDVDYLINYDLDPNPAKMEQRSGRIHRINSKNNKIIINYIGGVVGYRILQIINNKEHRKNQMSNYKFIKSLSKK